MDLHGMLMQISLIGVIISTTVATTAAEAAQAKPGCGYMCGDVKIPFPFGLTDGCYLNKNFHITCEDKVTAKTGDFAVKRISIEDHELRVLNFVARRCYNKTGGLVEGVKTSVQLGRYTISNTKNKFTVVGCDTYAYLTGTQQGINYSIGCMSLCDSLLNVVNGSCSGVGCCEVGVPVGLKSIEMKVRSYDNHIDVWDFNTCGYAFLAEQGQFDFSSAYLTNLTDEEFPIVLEWAIGNETCKKAAQNKTAFACERNSYCQDLQTKPGYLCKCKQGYQGNPYLPDGCQDINECEDPNLNNCAIAKNCVNTPGSYNCHCPKWQHGSGRKDGEGCEANPLLLIAVGLGTSLGVLFLLTFTLALYKVLKKRSGIKLKKKFFKQNGGLLLERQLSSNENNVQNTKLFNSKELKKATDHFSKTRIVGKGGQGTIFKGMLSDGRIVAIKKCNTVYEGNLLQFINEIVILSQINHRNVVKLIGCCLEVEIPLLVYEYIPNGTLFQYLQEENEEFPLTWDMRLKIATEIVEALFYLHSAASSPIYHRDIKSTNILLDEKYKAKVADFGISKTITIDQTHVTTLVQGTFGYLDPEYFQTSQFSEKSDVYSFGVVLVELLTGEKPISSTRSEESRSLSAYFILSMKENHLFDILDDRVKKEGDKEKVIKVANLAKRCLHLNGKKRPTMREVATELQGIQKTSNDQQHYEELQFAGSEEIGPPGVSFISTQSCFEIASSSSSIVLPLIHSQ